MQSKQGISNNNIMGNNGEYDILFVRVLSTTVLQELSAETRPAKRRLYMRLNLYV